MIVNIATMQTQRKMRGIINEGRRLRLNHNYIQPLTERGLLEYPETTDPVQSW